MTEKSLEMSCDLKLHFKITAKIAQKGPVFLTLFLTTEVEKCWQPAMQKHFKLNLQPN